MRLFFRRFGHASLTASLALVLTTTLGCSVDSTPAGGDTNVASSEQDLIGGRVGAVYTLSDGATSNDVIVFRRAADGSLQRASAIGTGGKGTGGGLGSQGALTLSSDRHWLYAVNAGSNELSIFFVHGELLYLVDCIATGGVRPISVTVHGDIAYVLHAGDATTPGGIRGFRQRFDGTLAALSASAQPLSAASVGPAQISFSHDGRALLVTEKMSNKIDEYLVDFSGRAQSPVVHASNGMTPFGFAITSRGQAIVSEAFGGAPDAGAISSYRLDGSGGLVTVSASVPDTESAPCWVVLTRNDRFAFVSNTASGTVSSYDVAKNGSVTLVGSDGRSGDTGEGSKPIDMALTTGDTFLYVLDSGTARISGFHVGPDGSLAAGPGIDALPASAVGLAAQ